MQTKKKDGDRGIPYKFLYRKKVWNGTVCRTNLWSVVLFAFCLYVILVVVTFFRIGAGFIFFFFFLIFFFSSLFLVAILFDYLLSIACFTSMTFNRNIFLNIDTVKSRETLISTVGTNKMCLYIWIRTLKWTDCGSVWLLAVCTELKVSHDI